MREMIIRVPENVTMTDQDLRGFLAAKLFETKKATFDQAAEIAGVNETEFIDVLQDHDVRVARDTPPEETRDAGQF
jgi:predicted HTH domain antitoxin